MNNKLYRGLAYGLPMSLVLWVLIIWLVLWLTGCGGSPQANIVPVPGTPPPVVGPPSVPPPPALPTYWTVTDLIPLPGFNAAQANAVNAAGIVVGYSEMPDGTTEATGWVSGIAWDLGPGIATALNDSGQIVGYSVDPVTLGITAHIWFNGVTTDIGSWIPRGINNHGLVVGEDVAGLNGEQWSDAGLQPIPGCKVGMAVNDSGQIAGIAYGEDAAICGMTDFGNHGAASAVNKIGQAAGYWNNGVTTAAMLWPDTQLGIMTNGIASGINDYGWIVGETFTTGTNVRPRTIPAVRKLVGVSVPFLWTPQANLSLPDPHTTDAIQYMITAEGINGTRIVGAALALNGDIHGFLLEGK